MKFDITKKVDLSYIDGWKECYLEFAMPSYGDIKDFTKKGEDSEMVDKGIQKLEDLFRGGKGMSEGKQVDITKEDIKDLPMDIITKSIQAISGEVDPKPQGNSTTA